MNHFGTVPFLRPVLALGCGMALQWLFPVSDAFVWPLAVATAVFLGLTLIYGRRLGYAPELVSGASLMAVFLSAGIWLCRHAEHSRRQDFAFGPAAPACTHYRIRLTDELTERLASWRAEAEVLGGIDSRYRETGLSGKLLLYLAKTSDAGRPALQYGDELLVPARMRPIPGSAFPDDFDFAAVMRHRNTGHQLYLSPGQWALSGKSPNALMAFSYTLRDGLVERLYLILPRREAGLLASLLVGYRDGLDEEDRGAFSRTGTMHILAVSGMHVGLLYLLLCLLFAGKTQVARLRRWQSVLIILLLWLFALVTGLSASVMRAALMFTIIETGRSLLLRRGNLLNSLFASAFVQWLIEPLSLADPGFQLSYLAVLGIALLHPWLRSLWMPPGRALSLLYESALLSVSATAATLPVTLFFFGTFPLWFIPANLFAVPLSTVLMGVGLLAAALADIPLLGAGLVYLTQELSWLLTAGTRWIGQWPGAVVDGIFLTLWEALLLFVVVGGVVLRFMLLKTAGLYLAVGALLLLCGSGFYAHLWPKHRQEAVICSMKGHGLVYVCIGERAWIFSRPLRRGQADSMYGKMKAYGMKHGLRGVQWAMAPGTYNLPEGVSAELGHTELLLSAADFRAEFDLDAGDKGDLNMRWIPINGSLPEADRELRGWVGKEGPLWKMADLKRGRWVR